jgi:ATP-dependent exoDNAse (exonuclease V) beta subunit
MAAGELALAVGKVLQALRGAVGTERGRWLLAKHEEARSEWPLSGILAGRLVHAVIDRTFIDDGIRWIVDYKTSEPRPGDALDSFLVSERERYRPQLQAYAELCRRLEPGREIRMGLYFPLFDGWCEVAPGESG